MWNSSCGIDYQHAMIADHFAMIPSDVRGQVNTATEFFKHQLYNKIYSVFKIKLPKYWDINWFRYHLFRFGSIAVVYTHKYGWVCNPYSVLELNWQYNPKIIQVTNAFFDEPVGGEIDVNAGIVHLFDSYLGVDHLVSRYAELLANTEKAININLANCNVAYLFEAESKKQASEIKDAYQQASEGHPLVVLNKKVLDGNQLNPLIPGVKNNFIAADLMELRRAIMNAFLTEIGIRNVSVQKKERLTSGETQENNDETKSIASIMLENMQSDFEYINQFSDLGLSVELAYGYENVSRETSGQKNVSRET